MKKLLLIVIGLSVLSVQSCNDEKESADGKVKTENTEKKDDVVAESSVPAAVVAAFKAKYPTATNVEWETAKENDKPSYKAKWKNGDAKMKVEFGADGSFIKEDND